MKIFKRSCSVNQKNDINYKITKKNYESNFIPYLYVYMSWLLNEEKNVVEIKMKKISNFFPQKSRNFELSKQKRKRKL